MGEGLGPGLQDPQEAASPARLGAVEAYALLREGPAQSHVHFGAGAAGAGHLEPEHILMVQERYANVSDPTTHNAETQKISVFHSIIRHLQFRGKPALQRFQTKPSRQISEPTQGFKKQGALMSSASPKRPCHLFPLPFRSRLKGCGWPWRQHWNSSPTQMDSARKLLLSWARGPTGNKTLASS